MSILTILLISTGILFLSISAIGAIRLPDFFSRAHAMGVVDTLGCLFVLSGLMVSHGFTLISLKLFLLILFIFIANPTVTHIFVRAAYKARESANKS